MKFKHSKKPIHQTGFLKMTVFTLKDYALSTEPLLKHLVQTCNLFGTPFTLHFTRLTFGFQIAFVFLFEWLTLCPNWTPLPQISHFAISTPPYQ
jgi:hypothetical protein